MRNGKPGNGGPEPDLIAPSATAEEAAVIVAAVERFRRATATAAAPVAAAPGEWSRAAILEGVSRQAHGGDGDPWINT
jgi:hypothetical protein